MTITTTARYQRTHGKSPRGKGTWAFKRSTTRDAYDADCYGPSTFAPYGTYTQARRWAESTHRDAPYTALLP